MSPVRLSFLFNLNVAFIHSRRIVSQQIGRAELGDDTEGVHSGEVHSDLKPGAIKGSRED